MGIVFKSSVLFFISATLSHPIISKADGLSPLININLNNSHTAEIELGFGMVMPLGFELSDKSQERTNFGMFLTVGKGINGQTQRVGFVLAELGFGYYRLNYMKLHVDEDLGGFNGGDSYEGVEFLWQQFYGITPRIGALKNTDNNEKIISLGIGIGM